MSSGSSFPTTKMTILHMNICQHLVGDTPGSSQCRTKL